MYIRDGWLYCDCGKAVTPVEENTTLINPDLLCKRCKRHLRPTIINGRIYTPGQEPQRQAR